MQYSRIHHDGAFWHSCLPDFEDNQPPFDTVENRLRLTDLSQAVADLFELRKQGLPKQKYHTAMGAIIQHLAWSRVNLEALHHLNEPRMAGAHIWTPEGQTQQVIRKAKLARLRMHAKGRLWSNHDAEWRAAQREAELQKVVNAIVPNERFGAF